MPVKAMMTELISAVEENASKDELSGEEKDDTLRVSGTLDSGSYTLSIDKDGNLCGFEMPNNKLTMSFTDLTVTGTQQETSSSAETSSATTAVTTAV